MGNTERAADSAGELTDAVRAAVSEALPGAAAVDPDALAAAIVAELARSFRVPTAHDVADVISPLIPTPAEVAAVVSEQMVEKLPAVTNPPPSPLARPVTTTIAHLEVELATLHQQLQAAQQSFSGLADEVAGSARRARDQVEATAERLSDEIARLGRRVDDRLTEVAARPAAADRRSSESSERELRTSVRALEASIDRLEQTARRIESAYDPRTLARLVRTLQVLVTQLRIADDEAAEPDIGDPARGDHPSPAAPEAG